MIAIPSKEAIGREKLRRSLALFVRRAWQEIDPAPLVWNWHLDAICLHLQAVSEGTIRRLLISVPPGHAKSMIVAVLWPAWEWLHDPSWSVLCASYAKELALRDARKCRNLIESDWYKSLKVPDSSGSTWELSDDQNQVGFYGNTAMGSRKAIGVEGQGTGFRGDARIIDDPLSAQEAHSEAARKFVLSWWDETMPSRLNDLERGQTVIIAQRLHEEDLPGHVLAKGGYVHLRLPTEYEVRPTCPCPQCTKGTTGVIDRATGKPWRDPRCKDGELLFPAKFGEAVIAQAKVDLGSAAYSAQHQQNPVPAGGGLIKRRWFRHVWRRPGEPERPLVLTPEDSDTLFDVRILAPDQRFDQSCIATDAAFKETTDSDFVAVGAFGRIAADVYLLDLLWERADILKTIAMLLEMSRRWPRIGSKIVEDKANGPAILTLLKGKLPGLIPVKPLGGKEARIQAVVPLIEAGNFILPLHHPKRRELVGEACSFPYAAHDDAIDMCAYGLLRIGKLGGSRLSQLVASFG